MSFNKKHVPALEEIKKYHAEKGDEFILSFEKADCLIGPTESIDYVYSNLNRINGRSAQPNSEIIEEAIAKLTEVYTKLKTIPEFNLASSEIKKVINYITIKQ
jgi:hypothetical protein